jgi:D-sedoheptulose 7-phosphate isomerase
VIQRTNLGAKSSDVAFARVLAEVEAEILDSRRAQDALLHQCAKTLVAISMAISEQLRQEGKLILFGNGGSAADAQHIAAEFVGRYQLDRRALPALALTTNSSTLTAIANDYGYEQVFARQIEALAKDKDVALGISTSGDSPNVIGGLVAARKLGVLTIGFTGATGGKMKEFSDHCLCVPSNVTARIQECHLLAGHIISGHCERVLAQRTVDSAAKEMVV